MSSAPVPSWKSEFDRRMTAFATAIDVEEAKVREILTEIGVDGESEQSLTLIDSEEYLPLSDLFKAFCDSGLTKKATLRFGLSRLRSSRTEETSNVNDALVASISGMRPVSRLSDRELLERYDEHDTEIMKILAERTHARPFLVFENNSCNVEASFKLLKLARTQPMDKTHRVDGEVVRLYRSGTIPAIPLDESPFILNRALVDGYCAETDTDWTGTDIQARQLCRIHWLSIEKSPLSMTEMRRWSKLAKNIGELKSELGPAWAKYKEMDERGELPKLRIFPDEVSEVRVSRKDRAGM